MHRSIFVSSTFRDMHLERDAIHTKIIPAVNAAACKYGDSVSACDLRWGIDTSGLEDEKSSEKVLNICLGEIDRCRPYMIVLLGYRYGWIPDRSLINQAVREREDFSLEDEDISVTALEIEYGALSHLENIDRTLFYFREIDGPCDPVYTSEDELHRKKLAALKDRILSIPGAHVQTYHVNLKKPEQSMQAFATMVFSDLHALMKSEWELNSSLDRYALDQKLQWEYLEEKSAQFLSRQELLSHCCSILSRDRQDLLIHGSTGSGKSTLISRLGKELSAAGADVVPIFCGYTSLASSGFDLIQYMVYELERRLDVSPHFSESESSSMPSREAWLPRMQKLLEAYSSAKTQLLVFLIDGIDQLTQDDIAENWTFLPDSQIPAIRFALSTVTASRMPLSCQVELSDLSAAERSQVIAGILRGRHRELPRIVVDRMIQHPGARLPLYLSLMIQRLIMMDHSDFGKIAALGEGMEAIAKYQLSLIQECPDSLEELSVSIMGRATDQIGGEPVKLMGYFLALSRRGLRFSDLERLVNALRRPDGQRMQLSMADTAAYLQYFRSFFFIRNDGRIDFTHKCFREGLCRSLENSLPLHALIASWLQHLPPQDAVRSQELSWHLIQLNESQKLADLQASESDNASLCDAMMKDLAEVAVRDKGAWIRNSLYETSGQNSFLSYSGFICNNVFFELPASRKGIEIRQTLVLTVLEIEEKILKRRNSHAFRWDVTVNLERLSSIESAFGTPQHTQKAVEYAERCLTMRQELLNDLSKMNAYHQQLKYLKTTMADSGMQLTSIPSPRQTAGLISVMHYETLRGVCVAHELVAQAYGFNTPDSAGKALPHLKESLAIRTGIFNSGQETGETLLTQSSSDEEYELAVIHQRIADAYQSLRDSEALPEAEKHLRAAVQISGEALRKEPSDDHAIILSSSLRLLSGFLANGQAARLDEALILARQSLEAINPVYERTRSAETQLELSLIFHLLGDLYTAIGGSENLAVAHQYYERMKDLTNTVVVKTDSMNSKKAAVVAGIKSAESAESLSLDEMKKAFASTYLHAKELFESFRNDENCQRLEEVYQALIGLIEKSDFGRQVAGQRAVIELRSACLDLGLERDHVTLDMMKQRVVEYNELNDKIQSLGLPDDADWPEEWVALLECVDIPRNLLRVMPARRAYELSRKSCDLSRKILELEDTLLNRDSLAVSLSKLSAICMQVDLDEFVRINQEFLTIAQELNRINPCEKYAMMILQAQMGTHLAEGSISEFLDSILPGNRKKDEPGFDSSRTSSAPHREAVSERKLRDLFRSTPARNEPADDQNLEKRKALENKILRLKQDLASVTGHTPVDIVRRYKIDKELKALQAKLAKL